MRHTGGLASGLTRTRSSPASSAMTMASSVLMTPTDSLSSSMRASGRSSSSLRGGPSSYRGARASTATASASPPPRRPRPRASTSTEISARARRRSRRPPWRGRGRGSPRRRARRGARGCGSRRGWRRARWSSRARGEPRWRARASGSRTRRSRSTTSSSSFACLFFQPFHGSLARGEVSGRALRKATSVLAGGSRSVRGRTRDSVRFLAAAACACRARVSW